MDVNDSGQATSAAYNLASGTAPMSKVDADTGAITIRAFPVENRGALGSFVGDLLIANRDRNGRSARITSRMSMEQPFPQAQLVNAGLGWKSNFSTRPLNSLVQRAYGRYPRAIHDARYLTSAELPSEFENSGVKTARFRKEFTDFIRGDARFVSLVEDIARETVTFGFASAGFLHPQDWFPVFWRQDVAYFPSGTGPNSHQVTGVAIRQILYPHEAFEQLQAAIAARDAADLCTFDTHAMAESINRALPEGQRVTGVIDEARRLEDLRRQLALRGMYGNGAGGSGTKTVLWWNVLAAELNGRISHYILDDGYRELFRWEERFDSFSDLLTLFTFENGDGSLHGSLGLGRTAFAMAQVLDRVRNDAVDRMNLSGKIILSGPDASISRFKLSVVGATVLINNEFKVEATKIPADPEHSLQMDAYLKSLLDEASGTTSPKQLHGDRVTKAQIDLLAGREDERSDDYVMRFVYQFGMLLTQMQKRLLDPDIGKLDARVGKFQERLNSYLSADEIEYFRNTASIRTVHELTEVERQIRVSACMEGRGNPAYDQSKLERAKLDLQCGPGFADEVLAPTPDANQAAEQNREALMENSLLLDGHDVPVSARDNHLVHLQVHAPVLGPAAQTAVTNPDAIAILRVSAGHIRGHIEAFKASKQPVPPELEQLEEQVSAVEKSLQQVDAVHADAVNRGLDPVTGQPTAQPAGAQGAGQPSAGGGGAPIPPGQPAPSAVPAGATGAQ